MPFQAVSNHLTSYAADWIAPGSNIILGAILLDNPTLLLTKEIVIIAGIVIGIITNAVRLYKDLRAKKDKDDKVD